ncbi:MAG: efflux RND transporter permease subunit, partial [Gemmatimonadota bacterium]|nr:efflux RND transporter permease subunit [Gemmatimonadota bacterium]
MKVGIAGRLADAMMHSKLTPLLLAAALGLGLWTVFTMPSEEEPQIVVPLADIYLPLPGATPQEIESRVLIPLEEVLSGIEGVEYVYTHAESSFGLATVRYEVGRDMEESLTRLHSTLFKHADRMPPGLGFPLVKTVTIDDVPFFTLTLSSEARDGFELRRIAEELSAEIQSAPGVRRIEVIGGHPREVLVQVRPERMAALGVDPGLLAERLRAANASLDAGTFTRADEVVRVDVGSFLAHARDVEDVVLDVRDGRLVQVKDVARVVDGPAEIDAYTLEAGREGFFPMVTLAAAKRPGADATAVGEELEARIAALEGRVIPFDVETRVTRNYGETAREKVDTLKLHLLLAILAVGVVVALAMGWRSALVVMTAVPVTFALTLLVYDLFGYTLNRVTLFALIFVTGIVIDDSIIIAENMHRHFEMRDRPLRTAARAAVDEVGNPTILATLTVIAAVLPMLFVSGLMGPYMSPMPIGATLAMLFSLLVALVGAPWLAFRLLGSEPKARNEEESPEDGRDDVTYALEDTRLYRAYRAVMEPLLDEPRRLWIVLGGTVVLLFVAVGMFAVRSVTVKMLPFDDKDEMQVIVDLPEGTSLERTLALSQDLARALHEVPEIEGVQLYVGTAAPFNFNGMIRHYYLRRGPHLADLQVQLVSKSYRDAQSHDVARRIRPILDSLARASGTDARIKVAEVPPGPPVLATLVAEVYGRETSEQVRVARQVRELFEAQPGVVDVDWSLTEPQRELRFLVDEEKAMLSGVPRAAVVQVLRQALSGDPVTHLSAPGERSPVPIRVRLEEGSRSGAGRLAGLHLVSRSGSVVPLGELVRIEEGRAPQVIDRKNGRRVVYVTADVAGTEESPVYAILDLGDRLSELPVAAGTLGQLFTRAPRYVEQPVVKWDGEWQITYEVFRDLGLAFAGALVLIYMLIVAWFGSLTTPLVMMAAIPLTLIGIAPGHLAFGAFFTATSMIGMIALAGIMVRNGILLIDYLEARLAAGSELRVA